MLEIKHGAHTYLFKMEQGKPVEGFELLTLKGGNKRVVLQSNRPMLNARSLKKKLSLGRLLREW